MTAAPSSEQPIAAEMVAALAASLPWEAPGAPPPTALPVAALGLRLRHWQRDGPVPLPLRDLGYRAGIRLLQQRPLPARLALPGIAGLAREGVARIDDLLPGLSLRLERFEEDHLEVAATPQRAWRSLGHAPCELLQGLVAAVATLAGLEVVSTKERTCVHPIEGLVLSDGAVVTRLPDGWIVAVDGTDGQRRRLLRAPAEGSAAILQGCTFGEDDCRYLVHWARRGLRARSVRPPAVRLSSQLQRELQRLERQQLQEYQNLLTVNLQLEEAVERKNEELRVNHAQLRDETEQLAARTAELEAISAQLEERRGRMVAVQQQVVSTARLTIQGALADATAAQLLDPLDAARAQFEELPTLIGASVAGPLRSLAEVQHRWDGLFRRGGPQGLLGALSVQGPTGLRASTDLGSLHQAQGQLTAGLQAVLQRLVTARLHLEQMELLIDQLRGLGGRRGARLDQPLEVIAAGVAHLASPTLERTHTKVVVQPISPVMVPLPVYDTLQLLVSCAELLCSWPQLPPPQEVRLTAGTRSQEVLWTLSRPCPHPLQGLSGAWSLDLRGIQSLQPLAAQQPDHPLYSVSHLLQAVGGSIELRARTLPAGPMLQLVVRQPWHRGES